MNDSITKQIQGLAPLLQVFDMPVALGFYRDVLGFEVVQASGERDDVDWVLLKLNNIELMLNTAYEKPNQPSEPDERRIAAHTDTSLYFGHPDIDKLYSYLLDNGMHLKEPQITGYGWKAIYLLDPDGYLLCFHWPVN
ncbi:VOC family protein [Mucilaginibacter kameinonensis]|uniref:VOC family protein n=1 Tax=Mucilaginibacter kameinonensis TaxID=452286 RepID=UPI001ABF4FE4|nr:VOC family protein [Mucilaginibacter kameinonensis]